MDVHVHKIQIRLKSAIDLIQSIELDSAHARNARVDALRILIECVDDLEPVKLHLKRSLGKA